MGVVRTLALFAALCVGLSVADWALLAIAGEQLAGCIWLLAIYALTIVDVTVGLPHKRSLKLILPGVRWFDCVVYFVPIAAMIWLFSAEPASPWVIIGGIPLFALFGLYFMARMPALRRGSTISTVDLLGGGSSQTRD